MDYNDIKLQMLRYKIISLSICVGSDAPYEIERQMVSSIVVEKDYENFLFPFFQIEVTIPSALQRKMTKDSQNIRVNLNLGYGRFIPNELDVNRPISSEINGRFYALMPNMTPDIFETTSEGVEKSHDLKPNDYDFSNTATVQLSLYNEIYYNRSKVMINEVLTSTTLLNAAMFVIGSSGLNNLLVSPPTNNKVYSEFILPPISADRQLLRICNTYGMYSSGGIVFFDLTMGYIVDKQCKCTAWKTNEYYLTYLVVMPTSNLTSTIGSGCYCNSVERYNLVNIDPHITLGDRTMINAGTVGVNMLVVNNDTGAITSIKSTAKGSTTFPQTPTSTMVYSSGDNSANIIKNALDQSSNIISVTFSNTHLNSMTPNKEYILSIDDPKLKKLNGKYRLAAYKCTFEAEGEYWIPHYMAEFKK